MNDQWEHTRVVRIARRISSRLPPIRGAGKVTRRIVDRFEPPQGTLSEFCIDNGMQMRVDVSQKYERSMFFSPQLYEFRSTKLLCRHLKSGDTFVDVGAHVGLFTLLAAHQVGPKGRVVAIEPDPGTIRRLQWNVRINHLHQVRLVPQAVAAVQGELPLFRDQNGNTGANSLSARASASSTPILVKTDTLDAIMDDAGLQHVNVLKIDIEGWEVNALRDSRILLQRPRPLILIEAHDRLLRNAGSSLQELEHLFDRSGFTGRSISRRDRVYS